MYVKREENCSEHVSFSLPMIDRCRKITHHITGSCNFRSSFGNSNVHVRTTRNRAYVCSFQLFFLKGARARLKGVTGVLGGCVSGSNFLYRCMIYSRNIFCLVGAYGPQK